MQRLAMIPLAAALTLALAAPGFAQAPRRQLHAGSGPAPTTDKAPHRPRRIPRRPRPRPGGPGGPGGSAARASRASSEANSTHLQTNKKFEVIKA